MTFIWHNDFGEDLKAQAGYVTYRIYTVYGGAAAYLVVVERGGKRRLSLGHHTTIEGAKACCEQHFADGCDVSHAEWWK